MTPERMHRLRKYYGLSRSQWGEHVIGLQRRPDGSDVNIKDKVKRWEMGTEEITGPAARVVAYVERFGVISFRHGPDGARDIPGALYLAPPPPTEPVR